MEEVDEPSRDEIDRMVDSLVEGAMKTAIFAAMTGGTANEEIADRAEEMTAAPLRNLLGGIGRVLDSLARERRRAAAVRGLIEYRDTSDLCQCSNCRTVIERTGTFTCETCGYVGPVATMECACYDYSCSGEGGGGRGAGCWHGVATCPECRDGDRDVWELLRAIRTALTDDAPGRPGGEGEGR